MRYLLLLALVPATAFAQAQTAVVTSPKAEGVVGVKAVVRGTFRGGWPVVVVRVPTGQVYAQQPVAAGRGNTFTGEAYFGDKDNTGRGTRYELIVLTAPNQPAAAAIKPGLQKAMPNLPVAALQFVYRDERIEFGGHTWAVKKFARMDPGPNRWTDDKAAIFLDKKNHLHLGIVKDAKGWACTELVCNYALGFGTYTWTFRTDLAAFDSQAVLGLFTYENSANKQGIPDKEIDFELSRWGQPKNELGQFVVQPYLGPGKKNIDRFPVPAGAKLPLVAKYVWGTNTVDATCTDAAGKVLRKWNYQTNAEPGAAVPPAAGKERAIMNLWLFEGKPAKGGKPVRVVVEGFEFKK